LLPGKSGKQPATRRVSGISVWKTAVAAGNPSRAKGFFRPGVKCPIQWREGQIKGFMS